MRVMQAWMPRPDAFVPLQTNVRPLPFSLHLRLRRSRLHLLSDFGRSRSAPHDLLDRCEADPLSEDSEALDWEGVPLQQGALRLRPRWPAPLRRRAGGHLGRAAVVAVALTGAYVLAARPSPEATASLASPGIGRVASAFAPSGQAASAVRPTAAEATALRNGPKIMGSIDSDADSVTPKAVLSSAGSGAGDAAELSMGQLDGHPAAGAPRQRSAPRGGLPEEATKLVGFASAPFPYYGAVPGTESPFLNIEEGERRGHRSRAAAFSG